MSKSTRQLVNIILMLIFTVGSYARAGALSAAQVLTPKPLSSPSTLLIGVSAANPCIGVAAPTTWKVVVFVLENRTRSQVIGNSNAPYISSLASKCGSSIVWNDANKKVNGTNDTSSNYTSKPNYAVLTNGQSPLVSGLINNTYSTKTTAYSIYDQMLAKGISFKDYYGSNTGGGCSVRWNGDYHDPLRYYSSITSEVCNAHDVPISQFMVDVNSGNLPSFSLILPNSSNSMHDNSTASGDTYTKNFLEPFLNSTEYTSGHVALFLIFDEDTPVPNVLIAPSIMPGSLYQPAVGNNPVSHFSALRTWEEMLGLPLIGDTPQAPSLLAFFSSPRITLPTPTATLETPTATLETPTSTLPTSTATLPTSTATLPTSTATLETPTATLETPTATLPTSTATLETPTATLETPTSTLPTPTATSPTAKDTVGVFRPSNGVLYLKNSNSTSFADVAINYGTGGDYPITGDWDGNGTATIGIYRNGSFYLRNSNTLGFADLKFAFGQPGDQPVAGDWNGDGIDTIGVYRPATGQFLLRDSNSAGTPDHSFFLGNVGDIGIAGDWTNQGFDTVGVFRPSNGIIFLKNTNTTGFADIALNYGVAGDQPIAGDWDGDGTDTIGVYRNAQFLLRNSNTIGFADIVFGLGNPGDMPIAGNWDGLP